MKQLLSIIRLRSYFHLLVIKVLKAIQKKTKFIIKIDPNAIAFILSKLASCQLPFEISIKALVIPQKKHGSESSWFFFNHRLIADTNFSFTKINIINANKNTLNKDHSIFPAIKKSLFLLT